MDDDLLARIRRLYASIESLEESNLDRLPATRIQTEATIGFLQDFRGGMTDEELSNLIHSVVYNVANLRNHVKAWAKRTRGDASRVDELFSSSSSIRILADLANNDRHPYPPRGGGHSGKAPRVSNLNRVLRLSTRPAVGSRVGITLGPDGSPRIVGDGTAQAVITADVVDRDGVRLGELSQFVAEAIEGWEQLFRAFGLSVDDS